MILLIAHIISIVSNPLIIAAPLCYALIFKTSGNVDYSLLWMLISLLFTSSVGVFVIWGVRKGWFSDFDVSVRHERKPVFIFTAVVGLIYFLVVMVFNGPKIILATVAALLLGIFIDSIVNRKIKASVHVAVFSAFSITLALLYGGYFWILPVFIPVVAWSRIKLKRHKFVETIVGAIIGSFLVIFLYYLTKYIIM